MVKDSVAVHHDRAGAEAATSGSSRTAERRGRVTDAARLLFAEHGFHGTGVAQIALRSGVKVGQIYRDFACKEDIVAAISEADVDAFLDEATLLAAIEQADRPAIRAWIGDLVLHKAHPDEAPLLPEILAESSRNARIAAIIRSSDAAVRDRLLLALAALSGRPAGAERLGISADLIMTVTMGLCSRQLARLQPDSPPLAQRIQAIIDREIEALIADG